MLPTKFSRKYIQNAALDSFWDPANNVLYELCKRGPKHGDVGFTVAKLWLIGRTYAAAIERGAGGGPLEDIYDKAARKIADSRLDESISVLNRSLNPPQAQIFETHWRLMGCLPNKNKIGRNRRSLASKYLHFHCPSLFYLFDTRATASVGQLVTERMRRESHPDSDSQYAHFFKKCEFLRERIKSQFGLNLTPRQLDNVLLKWAADRKS